MSFPCIFYKDIVGKDAEVTLSFFDEDLPLPFRPRVGDTYLFWCGDDEDGYTVECDVIEVEYYVPGGVFWVTLKREDFTDECGCVEGDDCCVLEKDVAFYIEGGWEIHGEIRKGYARMYVNENCFHPEQNDRERIRLILDGKGDPLDKTENEDVTEDR